MMPKTLSECPCSIGSAIKLTELSSATLNHLSHDNNNKQRKKKSSHKVLERLYIDSQDFPFLRTPIISHDNIIIVSVFGSDVFAIDSMFKRILSFEEVKKIELYLFTGIKYYKESIARKIDNIFGVDPSF